MSNNSLQIVISELETLFSNFNTKFFNNELVKPVITVSPDTTKGAYGWCTCWKAWKKNDNSESYYEINLCAEYLNREFENICETMIHEMVHLLNVQHDIQDTSRNGFYHNKRFKKTAEDHGLIVEKTSKYGWSMTKLNDDSLEYIKTIDKQNFTLFRSKLPKKLGKGSKAKKYVCECCGAIIRATKEVNVTCSDCNQPFKLEG
jgi:rubrerythrin